MPITGARINGHLPAVKALSAQALSALRRFFVVLAGNTHTLWDTTEVVGVRSVGISAKGKWRGLLAALDATPEPEMKCFDPRPDGADAFDLMSELTGI